jgi:signal transduction histidine kinase/CheY-like chemotaxis protein
MKIAVRTRLTVCLLGLLTVGSVTSLAILAILSRSIEAMKRVVAVSDVIERKAISLRFDMLAMSDAMRGFLIDPSSRVEQARKKQADADFLADVAEMKGLAPGGEIRNLCQAAADMDSRVPDPLEDEILEHIAEGNSALARARYTTEYLPLRRRQDALITAIGQEAVHLRETTLASAQRSYALARAITWSLVTSVTLLGVVASLLIARTLSLPIVLAEQYRAALAREQQAQRLEALGTLAAGIAHDFNNLLMGIRSHAELAHSDPADAESSWNAILNACARGSQVVRSMLSFSRGGEEAPPSRLALGASVEESLRLLRAMIPSSIGFETELHADTPKVMADAAQVQQILVNLVGNSADAIGDHPGRIHVRAGRRQLTEPNVFKLPPGVYAELQVSDDGQGMDEATRQRVFEPFFTTKGPEKGTGMGLAVVHGIVTAAGGVVECESVPAGGTRFTILWPAELTSTAAEWPIEAVRSEHPAFDLPPGTAVLVVDDEPEIAQAIARFLQKRRLVVTARYDPQEALQLVRADPTRFAAVVCDLIMPAMRGDELCRAILEVAPEIPVILSSGTESVQIPDCGFAGVLVKPYGLDDLGKLLAHVLTERTRT